MALMCEKQHRVSLGEPASSFVPRLPPTRGHTFSHASGGYVTQLLLLGAEDEPNLKMIYGGTVRSRARKTQVGKAEATCCCSKGYFETCLQFPVLVKRDGANNVPHILREPGWKPARSN